MRARNKRLGTRAPRIGVLATCLLAAGLSMQRGVAVAWGPPVPTGACCDDSGGGSCTCTDGQTPPCPGGGTYLGGGSTCGTSRFCDCNGNGICDATEIAGGASDCDMDGLLDACNDPCPVGACCQGMSGLCIETTAAGCAASGGVYRGDGSSCVTANCPVGCACQADIAPCGGDGSIDLDDFLAAIDCVDGIMPCGAAACDVNCDGQINLADVCAVRCQFGGPPNPACCTLPRGACCGFGEPDRPCEEIDSACCASGGADTVYFGNGSSCAALPPNEAPGLTCADTIDNDCDDVTDCADPDCAGDPGCPCPCDADIAPCGGNGTVDLDDLLAALDCLDGIYPCGPAACDVNCDGQVTTADFCAVLCQEATPDPSCCTMPRGACCGFGEPDRPCEEIDSACCGAGGADTMYFGDGSTCAGLPDSEVPGSTCADNVDNDCDDLTDCLDPDCCDDPACPSNEVPGSTCADMIDNDCDGLTDCADPDCCLDPICTSPPNEVPGSTCADTIDNDCDGLTDCADPDCCQDPACGFAPNEVPGSTCADMRDNDCDGLTDCADPDCCLDPSCAHPPNEVPGSTCADMVDNDCDGLTDCADSDCAGDSGCPCPCDADVSPCGGDGFVGFNDLLAVRECVDGFFPCGMAACDVNCDGQINMADYCVARCQFGGGGASCCNPTPTGACCGLANFSCDEVSSQCCAQDGGTYFGDGTTCPGLQVPPNEIPGSTCADGDDNDCDGLADCEDPDCCFEQGCPPPPGGEMPNLTCHDGEDNDCDGLTDCDDSDCCLDPVCGFAPNEVPGSTCADSIDNDCDGLTDCADGDCCVTDPACGLCDGDIVPLPCGNGVVDSADLQAAVNCLEAGTPPPYCDVNSDGTVDIRDVCDVYCQLTGGGAACCTLPEGACCGLTNLNPPLNFCEEIPAACCAFIGQQANPDAVYRGDGSTCATGCCGDGVCNQGETACDCLQDCGLPPNQEFRSGDNPTCGDLVDNDCDKLIDCADPDCEHAIGCPCTTDAECQILDDSVCHCEICDNGVCMTRRVSPGDIDCRSRDNFCVDLNDILCVLNGFAVFSACPNGDQAAPDCTPNGVIDLDDILFVLDAFGGEFDKATCNCPDCISACLLPDSTCDELTEGDCCTANGCWRPFERCATIIITEACTTALGDCVDATVVECLGAPYYGTLHGAGTCCFQTSIIGACCLPGGSCADGVSHIECRDNGGALCSFEPCTPTTCTPPCAPNSCAPSP